MSEELKKFVGEKGLPKLVHQVKASMEQDVRLSDADSFYKEFNSPVKSRAFDFMERVKGGEKLLDESVPSRIMEFNGRNNKWRWRKVSTNEELKSAIAQSESGGQEYIKLRESAELDNISEFRGKRESFFDGFDDAPNSGVTSAGPSPGRVEYTPLISSPFFKQLYLQDYLSMHSKCFWYKNYSAIAKAIIEMTRNFVLGDGFNVTIDPGKAQDAFKYYEDYSLIHDKIPIWCDEMTFAGESMIRRVPMGQGRMTHKSIDPSTIWEIVTEPLDLDDVKYYHQQYNTQYQMFTDQKTPISRYVINQIPPSAVIHKKINCTSWEKRGRSDLLAALLYFKHFDDAILAKLIRYKVEMSTVWDVTIKGNQDDVKAYIASSMSTADVPPNSESVHNEALTRQVLSPTLARPSDDAVINHILAYCALSVNLPSTWLAIQAGGETKASAVVKTEPVIKKMLQRRKVFESIINTCIDDALIAKGIDPMTVEREVNFPDMVTENRSDKIIDIYTARDNQTISHETASNMIAQQLDITNYDFDQEQAKIADEKKKGTFPSLPEVGDGLTTGDGGQQDKPRFDRGAARDQNALA